jgi:hypothetical protein
LSRPDALAIKLTTFRIRPGMTRPPLPGSKLKVTGAAAPRATKGAEGWPMRMGGGPVTVSS